MTKFISASEAREKLTDYFDAARNGDFALASVLAADLERFIDWAEQNCPKGAPSDE